MEFTADNILDFCQTLWRNDELDCPCMDYNGSIKAKSYYEGSRWFAYIEIDGCKIRTSNPDGASLYEIGCWIEDQMVDLLTPKKQP